VFDQSKDDNGDWQAFILKLWATIFVCGTPGGSEHEPNRSQSFFQDAATIQFGVKPWNSCNNHKIMTAESTKLER